MQNLRDRVRAYREHRAWRVCKHTFGHGAQTDFFKPCAAVCAQHDQVRRGIANGIQDGHDWLLFLQNNGAPDGLRKVLVSETGDIAACGSLTLLQLRAQGANLGSGEVNGRVQPPGMEDSYLRFAELGEAAGRAQGGCRMVAEVDRAENTLRNLSGHDYFLPSLLRARQTRVESRFTTPRAGCFIAAYYARTPSFRSTAIIGHQLVNADWIRLRATKPVNRYHLAL